MLVITCREPNRSEQSVIDSLTPLDGVVIVGFIAETSTQEREIDLLLMTPVRVTAIEVKSQPVEGSKGVLKTYVNRPWTINGQEVHFFGKIPPHVQARTNAQVFSSFLRYSRVENTPFIQSAVAITNPDVIIRKPRMVGQTALFSSTDAQQGVDMMRKKPVDLQTVYNIIDAMKLSGVTHSEIKNEWHNYKKLIEGIDTSPRVRPKIDRRHKTRKQRMLDAISLFIVIFLFVFFVYVMIHQSALLH